MTFDADDNVAVGIDGFFDFVLVDQARVGEDAVAGSGDAAEGGEIDIVQHPGLGIFRDIVTEHGEQAVACAARRPRRL